MELASVLPKTVARLLETGKLPEEIPVVSDGGCSDSGGGRADAVPGVANLLGCPRHLLQMRTALVGQGEKLFDQIDITKSSAIKYQDLVERLQALPREDLLHFGLSSDDDIVAFTSALFDRKYGSQPAKGGQLERALYGRSPSVSLFHEHCLDHATFVGPQGRPTVTTDTRAQLTITRGDFLRLLHGIGPSARPFDSERLRPALVLPSAHNDVEEAQQEALRQEEVLVDIDKPARVGLRVKTTEWFRRSRQKHGWPDVSSGMAGTVVRLVSVPGHVAWHYGTHTGTHKALQKPHDPALDMLHNVGDGLECPSRQMEFKAMFHRKTHQHHSANLADHINRTQQRRQGSSAFVPRSSSSENGGRQQHPGGSMKEVTDISRFNSERPWMPLHGTEAIYTTHDRQRVHVDYLKGDGRAHALHDAAPNKPFSRNTSAFWALPHAWGHHGSQHWSHPRRNWGLPAVASSGAGTHGNNIVAMVEWDNGNVGEYSLREHPHQGGDVGARNVRRAAGGMCVATLALALEKHPQGTVLGGSLLKNTRPMRAGEGAPSLTDRGKADVLLGCSDQRFAGGPQMFVLEAVSAIGVYEWAYSCALDSYLHTSWMSCVSGGPPVISVRRGLFSGLCAVANLSRVHANGGCEPAGGGGGGRHVASDWHLEHCEEGDDVLSRHPNFAASSSSVPRRVEQAAQGVKEEEVEAESRGGGEGCLWRATPHNDVEGDRRCPPSAVPRSGVKWIRIGLSDWSQPAGRELDNPDLAEALLHQREFSVDKWEAYGIKDLHVNDYVRAPAGDFYFTPDFTSIKEHQGWDDDTYQVVRADVLAKPPEIVWDGSVVDIRRSMPFQDYQGAGDGGRQHDDASVAAAASDRRKQARIGEARIEEARIEETSLPAVEPPAASFSGADESEMAQEGLRALVREVLYWMRAQPQSPELQQIACRLLAAVASLRLPDEESASGPASPVASQARLSPKRPHSPRRSMMSTPGGELRSMMEASGADWESSPEDDERVAISRLVTLSPKKESNLDGTCLIQPVPGDHGEGEARSCVRRTDGGRGGSCMWGWRVEQTLPLHFENVIEELWVGAVGSSGAFKGFQGGCKQYGGSIRWTLLALSTDPDEYTIPLEPNGELVNVSQVAKGWTGFFIKVEIDGPSCGGGNTKGSLATRVGDLALSFTPETFPELFNGGGSAASETAASSCCGKNIDMVVRVRLRPRFVQAGARRGANPAVPSAMSLPEGAAAADDRRGRKSTKGPKIQKAGQVSPAEGAAAPSKEALRDRSRQMVREASERQGLDRWDAAATVAWLGDLAALCDEGGALVVSAVIEDGGVELLMRILRRMSIPDGGWRLAGRGCLRILAIMVECRAALGNVSGHPFARGLLEGQLGMVLRQGVSAAAQEADKADHALSNRSQFAGAGGESQGGWPPRLPRIEHSLAGRVMVEEGAVAVLAAVLSRHGASCDRVAMHALEACLRLVRVGGAWRRRVFADLGARAIVDVIGRYGLPSSASNKAGRHSSRAL